MSNFISNTFNTLAGDHRRYSLEHRLFNSISLLNAVTNIAGAFTVFDASQAKFLVPLQLITGVVFFGIYYGSRIRHAYRRLYWPFVLTILCFLLLNSAANSGSMGGAHYYLIPALVIATILSDRPRRTVAAFAIFGVATLGLLLVEQVHPEWIAPVQGQRARFYDIAVNLVFVEAFTGILVMVLTRNLNQERAESDRLLHNILPDRIARELRTSDHVEPLFYESATVLFTDFVGFTRIAERMTPQELIGELDSCFRHIDEIVARHGLEKIKTIGDSYMAVGGIPEPNGTHAIDCVRAALEIQESIGRMRAEREAAGKPYWDLRLGMHTGPLVAGVIGHHKFAYDVWGDTVNTASRLESAGVAGRVNISAATQGLVKDLFECEYRGQIPAKNKGEIAMYFVNGVLPKVPAPSPV